MKHNMNHFTRTAVLLSLALIFQIGFNQFAQPAVGPLVNMTLIVATLIVGPLSATLIGVLTPLVAFLLGIMPLLPIVPFIMIGNAIFVFSFYLVSNKRGFLFEGIGVVVAALLKTAFLAFSVRYLVINFVAKVPPKLVTALSLPQLYTALIGGFLAIIIGRYLIKAMKLEKNK